tara:strand:- start:23 stop:223 length:201 start_codon:yes stop_codon:yes gene_type:complete
MQDLVELLIAFILGFVMKLLLDTECKTRLVEGGIFEQGVKDGTKQMFNKSAMTTVVTAFMNGLFSY